MPIPANIIRIPYTTIPNMNKNSGVVFNPSPDQTIIKQKKQELEKYGSDLYGQVPGWEKVIARAAEHCNVYSNNIVDLALRLEEDVAVMYQGRLAGICFCFPSGFIPSQRVGLTLAEIHKPVADGAMLVKASPGIARVMTEQDSFRRYVWTVTNNLDLSNHPENKKDTLPQDIDDLYFRYETQTTARVDSDTSLFFVKVDVLPLRFVYSQEIIDSLNSMTPAVLEYKNLTHIKNLLNSINDK